ncbi:hypothetical protein XENTR_v10024961 [Xenopus tropicalis]|nr:hypothetical protein XENTR_v10024961 [Xenopus tropicalis]
MMTGFCSSPAKSSPTSGSRNTTRIMICQRSRGRIPWPSSPCWKRSSSPP